MNDPLVLMMVALMKKDSINGDDAVGDLSVRSSIQSFIETNCKSPVCCYFFDEHNFITEYGWTDGQTHIPLYIIMLNMKSFQKVAKADTARDLDDDDAVD